MIDTRTGTRPAWVSPKFFNKKRITYTRIGTCPAGVVASGDTEPQPDSFSCWLCFAWTPYKTLPDFVPLLHHFCTRFLGCPKCLDTSLLGPRKSWFSLCSLSVQGSISRSSLGVRSFCARYLCSTPCEGQRQCPGGRYAPFSLASLGLRAFEHMRSEC